MPRPTCPGASALAGPPVGGPSVICGPLANDQDADAWSMQGRASQVVFTSGKDPGTYNRACCGDYTRCVIWRAEKDRIAADLKRWKGEERGPITLDMEMIEDAAS